MWQGALSLFVICVFVVYVGFIDDERRPTKSHLFRIGVGILAGVTVATIYQVQPEAYFLGALVGGFLGWLGILWIKHL